MDVEGQQPGDLGPGMNVHANNQAEAAQNVENIKARNVNFEHHKGEATPNNMPALGQAPPDYVDPSTAATPPDPPKERLAGKVEKAIGTLLHSEKMKVSGEEKIANAARFEK